LSNAVVALAAKGARFILVPNTMDITRIPSVKAVLDSLPDFVGDYFRGKVDLFNSNLATALNGLQMNHPGVKLFRCDIYTNVNVILNDASVYGFTEPEVDALSDTSLLDKSFDGPGADYVFWDPIHPTTKA